MTKAAYVRFKGIVATAGTDLNGYILTKSDLDKMVETCKGKPVIMEFDWYYKVGEVISMERKDNKLEAEFLIYKSSGMTTAVETGTCKPCIRFNLDDNNEKAEDFMALGLCAEPIEKDLPPLIKIA